MDGESSGRVTRVSPAAVGTQSSVEVVRMADVQRTVRALKHVNVERHAQGSHLWGYVTHEGGHLLADGVGVGADEGEHDHGDAGGPTSGYPPGRANPSASAAS